MTLSNYKILELSTCFFIISNILDYSGFIGLKYVSFIVLISSVLLNFQQIKLSRNQILFFGFLMFFFCLSLITTIINDGSIQFALQYNLAIITLIICSFLVDYVDSNKMLNFLMNVLLYSSTLIIFGNVFSNIYPVKSITNILVLFSSNYDTYEGIRSSSMIIVPKIYFQFTLFLPAAYIYFLFKKNYVKSLIILISIVLSLSRGAISIALIFSLLFFLRNKNFKDLIKNIFLIILFACMILYVINIFVPNIFIHFFNLQNISEFTVSTRLDQINTIIDLFRDNIYIFLFGMGSGTPIFLDFIAEYVYAIEIAPLDIMRKYGFIFFAFIFILMFRIIKNSSKIDSYVLLSLVLATFTNPILTAPIFILMFSLCNKNIFINK